MGRVDRATSRNGKSRGEKAKTCFQHRKGN